MFLKVGLPLVLSIISSYFSGRKLKEFYGEILTNLKKHVLWKSGHIAASLGLVDYFKKPNHDIRQGVDVPCQPEGLTPLHIAIMNNWYGFFYFF